MSMPREPETHAHLEGSEEYFSALVPETTEPPPPVADEVQLPPPQDMGEDG